MNNDSDSGVSRPAQESKPAVDPADLLGDDPVAEGISPSGVLKFNADALYSYEEQRAMHEEWVRHQEEPNPSFENVPKVDMIPGFNPTAASPEEIYARRRVPRTMQPRYGSHLELTGDPAPVDMWRVVERSKVIDGTGLVSSSILLGGTLGNIEDFEHINHLASNDASCS